MTSVLSLLEGNQNLAAYRADGLHAYHLPMGASVAQEDARLFGEKVGRILRERAGGLLVHREPNETYGDAIHVRLDDQPSNERPVLLMGHRDTVFPKGEVEIEKMANLAPIPLGINSPTTTTPKNEKNRSHHQTLQTRRSARSTI